MDSTVTENLPVRRARRRFLRLSLATVLGIYGGYLALKDLRFRDSRPETIARRIAALSQRHGVLIGHGAPDTFYVPPYTPADANWPGRTVKPARDSEVVYVLDALEEALGIYPQGFFSRLCKAIFICGQVQFGNSEADGSYGPAWIIVSADPKYSGTDIYLDAKDVLHHEFSSLVLTALPNLMPDWDWLWPRDRKEVAPDLVFDKTVRGEALESDGFLRAYGGTTRENDFNTYAETVFNDPGRLLELARKYPVVAHKTEVFIRAYMQLDPRMADVFKRLGLGDYVLPTTVELPYLPKRSTTSKE